MAEKKSRKKKDETTEPQLEATSTPEGPTAAAVESEAPADEAAAEA